MGLYEIHMNEEVLGLKSLLLVQIVALTIGIRAGNQDWFVKIWRFVKKIRFWKNFGFEKISFFNRIYRSVHVLDWYMWSIWLFLKTESVCVGLDSRFHDLSLNFGKIVILERYVFLRFLIKLIKLLLELRFLLSLILFLC